MLLVTGYFADTKTFTKVHVVNHENNKPICGCKISDRKQFQWNSMDIWIPYIECDHCKRIVSELSERLIPL